MFMVILLYSKLCIKCCFKKDSFTKGAIEKISLLLSNFRNIDQIQRQFPLADSMNNFQKIYVDNIPLSKSQIW